MYTYKADYCRLRNFHCQNIFRQCVERKKYNVEVLHCGIVERQNIFTAKFFPTSVQRFQLRHNKISMKIILRVYRRLEYRIAGNFQGRKLLQIGENTIFVEKTFMDCSLLSCQRTPRPKFAEKIFAYSDKTAKFAKVFSLESFPL